MINILLTLVFFSFVVASPVCAQVIRSYEGLDRNNKDGWTVQTDLSLGGRVGNVDYLDIELAPGLSYRVPAPGYWLRLYSSIRVRRSGKQSVVYEWSGHARHSYVFYD